MWIILALLALLVFLIAIFPLVHHWIGAFKDDDLVLSDQPHLVALHKALQRRSRGLLIAASVVQGLIIYTLFVGVVLVVSPQLVTAPELPADEEAKLMARRLEIKKCLREQEAGQTRLNFQIRKLSQENLLITPLRKIGDQLTTLTAAWQPKTLAEAVKNGNQDRVSEFTTLTAMLPTEHTKEALLVLDAVEHLPDSVRLKTTRTDEAHYFTKAVLVDFRSRLEPSVTKIDRLRAVVEQVQKAVFQDSGGRPKYDDNDAKSLEEARVALAPFAALQKTIEDELHQANADRERALSAEGQTADLRFELQDELEDVEDSLAEAKSQRDKIRFMAWLPTVTVRVVAVILLVFLTQIFVALYRYNTMGAAFYRARADALQLALKRTVGASTASEFASLVAGLSPDVNFEAPPSPVASVAEIAKAVAGRSV